MKLVIMAVFLSFINQVQAQENDSGQLKFKCSTSTRASWSNVSITEFDGGEYKINIEQQGIGFNFSLNTDANKVVTETPGYELNNEESYSFIDSNGNKGVLTTIEKVISLPTRVPCNQGRVLNPSCGNSYKKKTVLLEYLGMEKYFSCGFF